MFGFCFNYLGLVDYSGLEFSSREDAYKAMCEHGWYGNGADYIISDDAETLVSWVEAKSNLMAC